MVKLIKVKAVYYEFNIKKSESKSLFCIHAIFLVLLSGCTKRKVVDYINIGHNGRSSEEVKDFMLGVYADDVVFDIDKIEMDISFGVNSNLNSLEKLGLQDEQDADVIVFIHQGSYQLNDYHESIEDIPFLQILAKYNVVELLEKGYEVYYEYIGFLDRGKTTFNHTEAFIIPQDFVNPSNEETKFTIGIATLRYKEEGILMIVNNYYELRFGDIKNDKVYIRYWADAIKDKNMG